jgi:hypothetical protein
MDARVDGTRALSFLSRIFAHLTLFLRFCLQSLSSCPSTLYCFSGFAAVFRRNILLRCFQVHEPPSCNGDVRNSAQSGCAIEHYATDTQLLANNCQQLVRSPIDNDCHWLITSVLIMPQQFINARGDPALLRSQISKIAQTGGKSLKTGGVFALYKLNRCVIIESDRAGCSGIPL